MRETVIEGETGRLLRRARARGAGRGRRWPSTRWPSTPRRAWPTRGASTPRQFRRGLRVRRRRSRSTGWARAARRGAGRHAARAAWRARCEPPRGRGRRAAGPRRRGPVGLHDPARLRPARRGADAGLGAADRRRPVALPRLLVELRARASRCCSRRWSSSSARRCCGGASCASRSTRPSPCSPSPTCAARRARAGRWARGWRWRGRWRGRAAPGPTRRRSRSRLGAPARSRAGAPLGAGALAGPGRLRAAGDRGGGGARSGARGAARGRGQRARGAARVALAAAAVAVLALAPFAIVAGGDDGRPGARVRLGAGPPAAALPAGLRRRLRPNKLLEFYLPAILVAGSALWAGWALVRRDGFALAPLVAVGRRLPARAHRRVPPRAAVGRPGHRAGVRGRPRDARAAARRARRGARARRRCTASSGGPGRRCTRPRWRRSRRRRPTACARRRPTPPRCAA